MKITIEAKVLTVKKTSFASQKTGKVYEKNLYEIVNGENYQGHTQLMKLKLPIEYKPKQNKEGENVFVLKSLSVRGVADHAEFEGEPAE